MPDAGDGYQRLWAPDRLAYVQGENRPESDEAGEDCPFCRAPGADDETSLVVARGEHCYVVLNLYPYNPGHVLVCPYRHEAAFVDLTEDEAHELVELTQQTVRALTDAFAPHGFNLGINQGSIGGAGIAAHLHQHVVPRWGGDTNFMPVIGATKTMPALLEQSRDLIVAAW